MDIKTLFSGGLLRIFRKKDWRRAESGGHPFGLRVLTSIG